MSDAQISATFSPVSVAAPRIGVPIKWLRAEAEAGRIPSLRAGRQILLDVDAVVAALRNRAKSPNRAGVAVA